MNLSSASSDKHQQRARKREEKEKTERQGLHKRFRKEAVSTE